MNRELIVRSSSQAVDFALLKDGKLTELHKEENSNDFSVGDIFLAKIRKPVTGLNAAFVNVGYEKDAFLHYLRLNRFDNASKPLQHADKVIWLDRISGGEIQLRCQVH